MLLRSDAHLDNPKSDQLMQSRHLKECREHGGAAIDAGDLSCAMRDKYDPRSSIFKYL